MNYSYVLYPVSTAFWNTHRIQCSPEPENPFPVDEPEDFYIKEYPQKQSTLIYFDCVLPFEPLSHQFKWV